jgi:hypothetical protein
MYYWSTRSTPLPCKIQIGFMSSTNLGTLMLQYGVAVPWNHMMYKFAVYLSWDVTTSLWRYLIEFLMLPFPLDFLWTRVECYASIGLFLTPPLRSTDRRLTDWLIYSSKSQLQCETKRECLLDRAEFEFQTSVMRNAPAQGNLVACHENVSQTALSRGIGGGWVLLPCIVQ